MADDNAARQRTFRKKMRAEGYTQVTEWIPAEDKARHKRYVQGLRNAYAAPKKNPQTEGKRANRRRAMDGYAAEPQYTGKLP